MKCNILLTYLLIVVTSGALGFCWVCCNSPTHLGAGRHPPQAQRKSMSPFFTMSWHPMANGSGWKATVGFGVVRCSRWMASLHGG